MGDRTPSGMSLVVYFHAPALVRVRVRVGREDGEKREEEGEDGKEERFRVT